jgi:cytochrome b
MRDAMVRVWDPAIRVFHWGLAVSILTAWLTGDGWKSVHIWSGYVAASLVAFRLLWGFVGTRHARFADFIRSPSVVLFYLKEMVVGREARHIGHNPAGGIMIILLIVTIIAIAVTGWLQTIDRFWGEEWLEDVHETLADGLLVLIFFHLAGVLLASIRHRENLILAMITGRKMGASRNATCTNPSQPLKRNDR